MFPGIFVWFHIPHSVGRICAPCKLLDSVENAFETFKLLLQSDDSFLSFEGKRCLFPPNFHACHKRLSCGVVSRSSPVGKIMIANDPKFVRNKVNKPTFEQSNSVKVRLRLLSSCH